MNADDLLCSTEEEKEKENDFIIKRKRGRPKGSKNKVSKIKIKRRFGDGRYTAVRLKKYQKRSFEEFDPVDKPKRALLISSLPEDTTESDLKGYDCNIINVKFLPKHQTHNKKQVLVEFKSISKSIQCKDKMDAGRFKEVFVHAQYISPHTLYATIQNNFIPVTDHTKLYVTGFGRDASLAQLYSLFSTASSIDLALDPETNKPYGYAFIIYGDEATARQAHNTMQDFLYEGRALVVMYGKKTSPEMEQIVERERTKAKNEDPGQEESGTDEDDDDLESDDDQGTRIKFEILNDEDDVGLPKIKLKQELMPKIEDEVEAKKKEESDGKMVGIASNVMPHDDEEGGDEAAYSEASNANESSDEDDESQSETEERVVSYVTLKQEDCKKEINEPSMLSKTVEMPSHSSPLAVGLNLDKKMPNNYAGDFLNKNLDIYAGKEEMDCFAATSNQDYLPDSDTALDLRESFAAVYVPLHQTSQNDAASNENLLLSETADEIKRRYEASREFIERRYIPEMLYNQFGFSELPSASFAVDSDSVLSREPFSVDNNLTEPQNAPTTTIDFDVSQLESLNQLYYLNSSLRNKNDQF